MAESSSLATTVAKLATLTASAETEKGDKNKRQEKLKKKTMGMENKVHKSSEEKNVSCKSGLANGRK